jgi:hypothetical protein
VAGFVEALACGASVARDAVFHYHWACAAHDDDADE